jgi:acyl-CoA synthetase (NDP forming)
VAVIGASRTRGTIGAEVFHNLIANGFTGAVYPINPGASSVQGVRAYPDLRAVPDAIELAVIVVPAAHVPAVIDDCVAKGVKAVLIITAGFAETGDAGRAIQDAMLAKVRAAGMRMVGPNCLGLLNADPRSRSTPPSRRPGRPTATSRSRRSRARSAWRSSTTPRSSASASTSSCRSATRPTSRATT